MILHWNGCTEPGTTWANEMNFTMNYAPGAGSMSKVSGCHEIWFCINNSSWWPAVQHATIVLRLPPELCNHTLEQRQNSTWCQTFLAINLIIIKIILHYSDTSQINRIFFVPKCNGNFQKAILVWWKIPGCFIHSWSHFWEAPSGSLLIKCLIW